MLRFEALDKDKIHQLLESDVWHNSPEQIIHIDMHCRSFNPVRSSTVQNFEALFDLMIFINGQQYCLRDTTANFLVCQIIYIMIPIMDNYVKTTLAYLLGVENELNNNCVPELQELAWFFNQLADSNPKYRHMSTVDICNFLTKEPDLSDSFEYKQRNKAAKLYSVINNKIYDQLYEMQKPLF